MLESPLGLESFLTNAIRQGFLHIALEQVERNLKRVREEISKQISENVNIIIRSFTTNDKLKLLLYRVLNNLETLKNYKFKAFLDCYDEFVTETRTLENDLTALSKIQLLKIFINKLIEIQKKIYDFGIVSDSEDACLHASKNFILKENGTPLSPTNRLTYLKSYYSISEDIQMISSQLYLSGNVSPDSPSSWLLNHCTFLLNQIHLFAQSELYFTLSRGVEYPLQAELIKASFSLLDKSGTTEECCSDVIRIKTSEALSLIDSAQIMNSHSPTAVFMEQFLMLLEVYCSSIRGFHILGSADYTQRFIENVTVSLQTTFSDLYKKHKFRQGMIEIIPKLAKLMQSYHDDIHESLKHHLYLVLEHAIKDYLYHVLNSLMPLNNSLSNIKTHSPAKAIESLPSDHDLIYFANNCIKHLKDTENCGQIETEVNKIINTSIQTVTNSITFISGMATEYIKFEFHPKGGFGFPEPTPSHILAARLFSITSILQAHLTNYSSILSPGNESVKMWIVNLAKELKQPFTHNPAPSLVASDEFAKSICSLFTGLKLYFNNSMFSANIWDKVCYFLSPLIYHSVFLYVVLSCSFTINDQDKLELVQQTTEIEMSITDLFASQTPKNTTDLLMGFKRFLFSESTDEIYLPEDIIKYSKDGIDSYERIFEASYNNSILTHKWT